MFQLQESLNQILALFKFKRILETSQNYIGLWFIHLSCKLRSAEAKLSLKPTSCRSGSVHGANIYTVQVVTELRKNIKCNLFTHQQELNPRVMMWGARLEKTLNQESFQKHQDVWTLFAKKVRSTTFLFYVIPVTIE